VFTANGTSPAFSIVNVNVTFMGLTFTNSVTQNGVMNISGSNAGVNFTNIVFLNNMNTGSSGVISANSAKSLYFANTTFENNTANINGLSLYQTTAFFYGCTFNHNTATTGVGGGLYISYSTVNITNSIFINNTATNGAGILVDFQSTVSIYGTTFANNIATNSGGGISVLNAILNIINTNITSNYAKQGAGLNINSEYANISLTSVTFMNNIASSGDGNMLFCNAGSIFDIGLQFNQSFASNTNIQCSCMCNSGLCPCGSCCLKDSIKSSIVNETGIPANVIAALSIGSFIVFVITVGVISTTIYLIGRLQCCYCLRTCFCCERPYAPKQVLVRGIVKSTSKKVCTNRYRNGKFYKRIIRTSIKYNCIAMTLLNILLKYL